MGQNPDWYAWHSPSMLFRVSLTSWRNAGAGLLLASASTACFAVDQCIENAATFHGVNMDVLRAIMRVESGFNPGVMSRNSNSTVDHGLGGINTVHLPELQKHGITKSALLDPCVNTYVAAWHLRRKMDQFGNTWFGIGAYHSATPYYNARYQILIQNALVEMGVLMGNKKPVPPLKRSNPDPKPSTSAKDQALAAINSPMTVLD